ncbi:Sphingosine kinase 1 [Liparis tanakae]|uniref:Sphingosine kinase 1 n=1 Tax=Liparis tanakae TaxID=230148 RepID=A0A4Z2DYI1_9TELE|nr:Sphingosine kinase 1 [Liparis tanakae]
MVLVNPRSGRGQALQLFTAHVQEMLGEAAVPHTLVITGEGVTHRTVPLSLLLSIWAINTSYM